MHRTRDYRRKMNYTKAIRKRKIDHEIHETPFYNNIGRYIKGKIHCSCALCRAKSNGDNWKKSDAVRIDSMRSDEREYLAS